MVAAPPFTRMKHAQQLQVLINRQRDRSALFTTAPSTDSTPLHRRRLRSTPLCPLYPRRRRSRSAVAALFTGSARRLGAARSLSPAGLLLASGRGSQPASCHSGSQHSTAAPRAEKGRLGSTSASTLVRRAAKVRNGGKVSAGRPRAARADRPGAIRRELRRPMSASDGGHGAGFGHGDGLISRLWAA